MNPATEKKLQAAMDRIFYTQAEAANFRKRGLKAVKLWKNGAKENPNNNIAQDYLKNVVPAVKKLHKLTAKVEKDLEKLHDAGIDPALIADYYDGKEFRMRTQKLLKTSAAFEKSASPIVAHVRSNPVGVYLLANQPDVKVTVNSLEGFIREWNSLKIALNRI